MDRQDDLSEEDVDALLDKIEALPDAKEQQ